MDRNIVIPGQLLSEKKEMAGPGTYVKDGNIYSLLYGVANFKGRVSVVPFSGKYIPSRKDFIIVKVIDVTPSNWIMETGSPYDGLLHVSEFPKRVDSSEMRKFMDIGDSVVVRVKDVSKAMKVELSMREQGSKVLRQGRIIKVMPAKVPRVIGHGGSMVSILKKESNCDVFVGKNGRIWINGRDNDMDRLTTAIEMIKSESHISGLTDKVGIFLRGGPEGTESSDEEQLVVEEVAGVSLEDDDVTEETSRKVDVLLENDPEGTD
jgi:exosome complex component RRP4